MKIDGMLQKLLDSQIEHNATDMWLSSGNVPRLRRYGEVRELPDLDPEMAFKITASDMRSLIDRMARELGIPENWKQTKGSFDCSFSYRDSRFRGCASYHMDGPILSLRRLPPLPEDISVLGIPDSIMDLYSLRQGLVLVTGPTGSGKTTTLACILLRVARERAVHVVTLEDPVEYVFPSDRSLFTQKQVGLDIPTFADGIRISLRENPDIIVVGEMRDLETMRRAIEAASTGHLVFATLHTRNSVETIHRILNVFPPEEAPMIREMLADNIQAVVSQLLFRRKDGEGLVAGFEMFRATKAARNIIREDKLLQLRSVIESGERQGMFLMEKQLARLVSDGLLERKDAMVGAPDPDMLARMLGGIGA